MAQPNVAREPSMEEILASIRRIIESNDPITEGASIAASQPMNPALLPDEDMELEDDADGAYASQVPANDPGFPSVSDAMGLRPTHQPAAAGIPAMTSAPSMSREPAAEASDRTLSLADVAARVRAAAGRMPEPSGQRTIAPAPAFASSNSSATASVQAVSAPMAAAAQRPAMPVEQFDAPKEMLQPVATRASAAPAHTAAPSPVAPVMVEREPVAVAPPRTDLVSAPFSAPVEPSERQDDLVVEMPALAAPEVSLPARIAEAATLLSQEAGEQVARSFKELADVFNGIEHQSLEEMAQDMLRPMLREWLDDNLPTLVERLVREEIERVARGPRR